MTMPVQIPADVDREDRLLGDLTARQLIILTTTALAVYGVWTITGPTALIVFAVASAPLGLVGLVLAFGRRDGVSADRLLWAALTQRRLTPRAPRRPAAASAAGVADPDPRARRRHGAADGVAEVDHERRAPDGRWWPGFRPGGCWPRARTSEWLISAGTAGRWCAR